VIIFFLHNSSLYYSYIHSAICFLLPLYSYILLHLLIINPFSDIPLFLIASMISYLQILADISLNCVPVIDMFYLVVKF